MVYPASQRLGEFGIGEALKRLTSVFKLAAHARLPLFELRLHSSYHEVDLVFTLLGMRATPLSPAEIVGFLHQPLKSDLPDQNLVAFEGAVAGEHFAAVGGVGVVG